MNASKFCASWLQGLLFFLPPTMIAIRVHTTSYGNDLIGVKSCSKGKCHRHFGPTPRFSCLKADYSNSRKKTSFLLPYGKLDGIVKEKFKQEIRSFLELHVRFHPSIRGCHFIGLGHLLIRSIKAKFRLMTSSQLLNTLLAGLLNIKIMQT